MLAAGCPQPEPEPEPEAPLLFGLPVAEPEMIDGMVLMDHDPEVHDDSPLGGAECTNFAGEGFPDCYDEHDGSDFLLEDGFDAMEAGSATVIAAADGTVTSVEEGQYDHCHAEGFDVSCDGHPIVGNHVILVHRNGLATRYWHLMTDSAEVEVGQEVACGDVLGRMGSSGMSAMPHLHFEVNDGASGPAIDPFAGPWSQEESLWRIQVDAFGLPALGCEGDGA